MCVFFFRNIHHLKLRYEGNRKLPLALARFLPFIFKQGRSNESRGFVGTFK